MGLDEPVSVAGGVEVAADRHPLRVRLVSRGAENSAEAGQRPVGDDDVASVHLRAGAPRPVHHDGPAAPGGGEIRRSGAVATAVAEGKGGDGLGALPDEGPGFLGVLAHEPIEVEPGDYVAVGGIVGMRRPTHLELPVKCHGAEPVVAVVAGQGTLEAHVPELAHRAGRQPVAAGLLAGEVLLLHTEDVDAFRGEPIGSGGTTWPAADHEHVAVMPSRPRRIEAFARHGLDDRAPGGAPAPGSGGRGPRAGARPQGAATPINLRTGDDVTSGGIAW